MRKIMRTLALALIAGGLSAFVGGCMKQPTNPEVAQEGAVLWQCNPALHGICAGVHMVWDDPLHGPVALYKEGDHYTGLGDSYKRRLSRDEAIRLAKERDQIAVQGTDGKCY